MQRGFGAALTAARARALRGVASVPRGTDVRAGAHADAVVLARCEGQQAPSS
eukprot:SAG11_NODE_7852_length_1088_cov_1.091001_2_plen_51_part_01